MIKTNEITEFLPPVRIIGSSETINAEFLVGNAARQVPLGGDKYASVIKSLASKILNTPQAKELVVDPIVGVKSNAGRKVVKGAVDAANAAVSLKRKFKK